MKVWAGIPRDQDARRLALLAVIILALLALQPWLWGRVFDAAASFRSRQTQEQQLLNVQRLTEDIHTVDPLQQALLDQAAVAFPLPESAPLIVERVEGLAEAQGLILELRGISEQNNPANRGPAGLAPFDLNLTVAGPPRAALAFFDAVEHMQEFTQIENWSMEPVRSSQPGSKVYALSMKVRFFFQPE